jgi:hypothetical protein
MELVSYVGDEYSRVLYMLLHSSIEAIQFKV